MSAAAPLAQLSSLDRRLLHMFIAGTGAGEGIAVALPEEGWVLVDGCHVHGESVPLKLVETYRSGPTDRVHALLLSHPHEDHAGGFASVVEALSPEAIWLTARQPAGPHLLDLLRAKLQRLDGAPTSEGLQRRAVITALRAAKEWETRTGRRIANGCEGQVLDLPGSSVRATLVAPAPGAYLDRVLDELAAGSRARANHASLVLELEWESCRMVLGGDLPTMSSRGDAVATGWEAVKTSYGRLAKHELLKIPHHGSADAHHGGLMSTGRDRIWTVTPFNSQALPRLADPNGLPRLLGWETEIYLSRAVAAWSVPRGSARVPIASIRERRKAEALGDPFADAADDIRPDRDDDVLDPVWAFAFDREGRCVGRWHGGAGLVVELRSTRSAAGSPT